MPYLLVAGAELSPGVAEQFCTVVPQASAEVWPDTGHFPHLAQPRRFAALLAATGRWPAGAVQQAAAH